MSVPPDRFVSEPLNVRVPACTSTVPTLLKGTLTMVVPDPADFLNVPALLNPAEPLELIVWSVFASNVPLLLNDPPWKMKPAPVHVAVPLLSTRRPLMASPALFDSTFRTIPPLAKVVPVPLIVPPSQVRSPLTVTSPLPSSVGPSSRRPS